MSIDRSPNCSAYTDTVSTLVELSAGDPQSEFCHVKETAFSCQKSAFEKPDDATRDFMIGKAREKLKGCNVSDDQFSFSTNMVGTRDVEFSADRLSETGLASNCNILGNDPNEATHRLLTKCHPMYDMTDEQGNRVRNYNMTFYSGLATCDVSQDSLSQLYEDGRKLAAFNAEKAGWKVDKPEHLACSFSLLPHV